MSNDWAADTAVSLPQPSPHTGQVAMGGFVFNRYGLAPDIDEITRRRLATPTWAPMDMTIGERGNVD